MTVLDTNIVIYFLEGRLQEPLPGGRLAISVITESIGADCVNPIGASQTAKDRMHNTYSSFGALGTRPMIPWSGHE